jgi:hypothetical protein
MTKQPWYTLFTAAIILIGFFGLCYFMMSHGMTLGKDDQFRWDRLLLIFNAVQTLAVAAAGALLGSAVQQARVASAEARADAADSSAKQAQTDAVKAEATRRAIEEHVNPPGGGQPAMSDEALIAQIRAIVR